MITDNIAINFKKATASEKLKIKQILIDNYTKLVDEIIEKANYGTCTGYWVAHTPMSKKIVSPKTFIKKYGKATKQSSDFRQHPNSRVTTCS